MDASDRLESLAQRLEQALGRLDDMASRLDTVEDGFAARLGELGGTIETNLNKVQNAGCKETLTEMYDCPSSWWKKTKTAGAYYVDRPVPSILGGSTVDIGAFQ